MSLPLHALHVHPGHQGAWIVTEPGVDEPLSEHYDASAALRAATEHARERGLDEVVVHDRYHHGHRYHSAAGRR
jgi:hypothetical protein